MHYADSPPAVTYNSNFFGKNFFVQNQQADMSENSRSSEYSGGENSNSSEYSGGPKNDRTYSEYSDCSENSDDSEISGSKYSDDSKNFWYNPEVMLGQHLCRIC